MKQLVIGGLRFAVEHPSGLEPIETDATYAPFLDPGSPADLEAAVSLILDPAPDVAGLEVLFDTGRTWTAFRDGEDVVLRLRAAGGPADYLWQARLASAARGAACPRPAGDRVTVHCGPLLVERRPRPGRGAAVALRNPLHYPRDQLLLRASQPTSPATVPEAAR